MSVFDLSSSPFASKLHTNYAPTEDDVARLKSLLVAPSLQLDDIDARIAEHQKAIDELSLQRKPILDYVAAHKVLLSPIRRLPIDLLEEIFVACLPTDRNSAMSASEAPISLGRVCSAWRTISHATPIVSGRAADVAELCRARTVQRLEVAETWLARSGSCPLSVTLRTDPADFDPDPGLDIEFKVWLVVAFLRLLLARAAQWQDIDLRLPQKVLPSLSGLKATDTPRLRSFKLDLTTTTSYQNPNQDLGLDLLRSPHLSELHLLAFIVDPDAMKISFHQLTSLSLGSTTWSSFQPNLAQVLEIMVRCPRLLSFAAVVNHERVPILPSTTFESLTLESLSLQYYQQDQTAFHALRSISLPALRHLSLFGGKLGYDDDASALPDATTRFFATSNKLTTLACDISFLQGGPLNIVQSWLLDVVRALPASLERLGILDYPGQALGTDSTVDDGLLALLTPGPTCPCPRLTDLSIRTCETISDPALVAFIRAKADAGLPLRRLRIKFIRVGTLNVAAELESGALTRQRASLPEREIHLDLEYETPIVFDAVADYGWRPDAEHEWFLWR
ncbi:hypothetical protein MKEN_00480300 [Mycena kentingensis (nom. inval.)]|nr:hypothetical protein MKEN_00480300 [Mycena kentingensis (nom. inval.)]